MLCSRDMRLLKSIHDNWYFTLYYIHVLAQAAAWVATYVHTCTNETHSLAPLQDLIPTLAS